MDDLPEKHTENQRVKEVNVERLMYDDRNILDMHCCFSCFERNKEHTLLVEHLYSQKR